MARGANEIRADYLAACGRWPLASPPERLLIEEQCAKLLRELEALPVQLEEQIGAALDHLDFKQQRLQLLDLAELRAGAAIVHGPPRHGQDWVVGWLARRLQGWEFIRLELQPRSVSGGSRGLWSRLAGDVGLSARSAVPAIVAALFRRAAHQPILLVVRGINRSNYQDLLDQVWSPIREWCTGPAHAPHRPVLMVGISTDDPIQSWGYSFASAIAAKDSCSPAFVAVARIDPLDRAELERWASSHQTDLPPGVRNLPPNVIATQIADAVPGLAPEEVLVEVCDLCGLNYYSQEQVWIPI